MEKLIFIHASSRNYHIANIRMYVSVYELELNKLCPRCKRSSPRLYLKTRECRSQSNPAPVPRRRWRSHWSWDNHTTELYKVTLFVSIFSHIIIHNQSVSVLFLYSQVRKQHWKCMCSFIVCMKYILISYVDILVFIILCFRALVSSVENFT